MLRNFILKILIWKRFISYKNTLPNTSKMINPKMEFDILKGAVFWEDEGLMECHPDLGSAFGSVISYRTHLVEYPKDNIKNKYFNNFDKQIFMMSKKYFPDWIGFKEDRCSYNPELSDRIKRIKKVSEWKMKKIMKDN